MQDGLRAVVGVDHIAVAGEVQQGAIPSGQRHLQRLGGGGQPLAADRFAAVIERAGDFAHLLQDVEALRFTRVSLPVHQGVGAQRQQPQRGGGVVKVGGAVNEPQQAKTVYQEGFGRDDGAFPGHGVGGVVARDVEVELPFPVGLQQLQQVVAAQRLVEGGAVEKGFGQDGGALGQNGLRGFDEQVVLMAHLDVAIVGGDVQGE